MFYPTVMERLGYPSGAFVSATMTRPFRGRIVLAEPRQPGTVLWECAHDHGSIPEAFACAGEEIGRNGMT